MEILTTGYYILLMIFGFGALIFFHELGHFIAAKWAGIRTEAFAIGMGHPVVSWRKGIGFALGSTHRKVVKLTGKSAQELKENELAKHGLGETEYSLRWLPIGGFVKMLGQEDANPNAVSDDPRSYNMCPIGKRMIVVSAGVIMNLILAVVLFIVAFSVGVRFEAPVIGNVAMGSPAASAVAESASDLGIEEIGLQAGDRVLSIDEDEAETFSSIMIATAMAKPGKELEFYIERQGFDEPLVFNITPVVGADGGLLSIGVGPSASTQLAESDKAGLLELTLINTGLSKAGVKPQMRLDFINGKRSTTFGELKRAAAQSNGIPLQTKWTEVDKDGEPIGSTIEASLSVIPVYSIYPQRESAADEGLLGFTPLTRISDVDPSSSNADKLQAGDIIIKLGKLAFPRRSQIPAFVQENKGKELEVVVLRDGQEKEVTCKVNRKGRLGIRLGTALDYLVTAKPITSFVRYDDEDVALVEDVDTPIHANAPMGGTEIVAVNSNAVSTWPEFRKALRQATANALSSEAQTKVDLTIIHPTKDNPKEELVVTLSAIEVSQLHELSWTTQLAAYDFQAEFITLSAGGSPVRAVAMGFKETYKVNINVYLTLDRLIRGSVGVKQLRGPVGIVHIGVKIADRGMMYLIFFLAMISANLAVINFLPLPIVDGGLFIFLIYEKLKGRPPSLAFQNASTIFGLALIGTLFLVVTWNDISRLFS